MHQWKRTYESLLLEENNSLQLAIEKAQIFANAQAKCEREISRINRYKTKLSTNISTGMMKARSRCGLNGPPFHPFNTTEVFAYWRDNSHQLAEKVKSDQTHSRKC